MKKKMPLIIGLAIIVLIVLALIIFKKQKKDSLENFVVENAQHVCYEYKKEIEGGTEESLFNRESIEFSIGENDQLTGTHVIAPAEGMQSRATLVGVTDGNFVNAIATVSADNSTWKEQRVYKLEGERLYVGYQSVNVPMIQQGDILMYENIQELVFDTEEFFLNKVECIEM